MLTLAKRFATVHKKHTVSRMKNSAAQELGKKGGLAKSQAKTDAVRKNAKKPRGKWVTAISYKVEMHDGRMIEGLLMCRGKIDQKYIGGISGEDTFIEDLVAEDLIECGIILAEEGVNPFSMLKETTRRFLKV